MALKLAMQLWIALSLLTACAMTAPKPALPEAGPPSAQTNAAADILSTIPFTLHDNRLLVNVFLNGQGPFVMVFDTGRANTLTPEVQKILDLKSQGEEFVEGDGGGEARVRSTSVHLKSLQVGDTKLADQKFMVINLNPIRHTFRFPHLDGIIGFELLQQGKLRIDMDHQVIQLVKSEAPPPTHAELLNFTLIGNNALIEGKINNTPAKILLDTGDRSNLTLFRKFAHSSQLEAAFEKRESLLTGMGLGGPIRGKLASMEKVDLGPAEVDDVLTRLPLTSRGYFYQNGISASAGMGLLKNFNMEFDYKKQVVALQRRQDFKESSTFVPVPAR
jgi:hypothetical protein